MDIAELSDPIEVWKAVEGDNAELIALLRGDEPIRRRTRDALADWLEGELQPVKLPKGRPSKEFSTVTGLRLYASRIAYFGHDPSTELGIAGFRYEVCRRFIRKKGWHLKKAGGFYWSVDRLREKIAERQEIDLEKFINYLNRAKQKPPPYSGRDYVANRRKQIAYEIYRAKKAE